MNTENLWNSFLANIESKLSPNAYELWFKDTYLYSLDNGIATVVVLDDYARKHIEKNYYNTIIEVFNEITNTNFEFSFKTAQEIKEKPINKSNSKESISRTLDDAKLNSNYRFETFIVGKPNEFAFKAARTVAENPGRAYNPLFLYGKSGLGKTHLLQSIGNYIFENTNLKVLYVSSETFVNDYISAVRSNEKDMLNKIEKFKRKYRDVDVLLIDDIQFLCTATKGQEEFFHTFNELYNSNKQICIASDRSANDLKSLEDRLLTRFTMGLPANITPPDLELRMNIIQKKIARNEAAEFVPMEVIEYIANNFQSDIRQLEGAITRVFAYSSMMNKGEITLDTAVEALKDQLTDKSVFKSDIHRIQRVVCDYYKISIDDLKGKKRSQNINYPRQVAIYLCRKLTNESFPKIGTYFGGRDHSTIISACNKVEQDIKEKEQIREVINELKKILST